MFRRKVYTFSPEDESGFWAFIDALIEFKLIWPSVGYASQKEAKRALIKVFTENKDFILFGNNAENPNGNTGVSNGSGRPAENIYLTESFTESTHSKLNRAAPRQEKRQKWQFGFILSRFTADKNKSR